MFCWWTYEVTHFLESMPMLIEALIISASKRKHLIGVLCFAQGLTNWRMASHNLTVCAGDEGSKVCTSAFGNLMSKCIFSSSLTPQEGQSQKRRKCPPPLPWPQLPSTSRDLSTALQSHRRHCDVLCINLPAKGWSPASTRSSYRCFTGFWWASSVPCNQVSNILFPCSL